MSGLTALALTLATASPSCPVEATVVAVEAHDEVHGIARDRLVLEDVVAPCVVPPTVLVTSAWSRLYIVGTPLWEPGVRYRFSVQEQGPHTAVVGLREGVQPLSPPAPGSVRKAGNNQPPCGSLDTLRWREDRVTLELDPRGLADVGGDEILAAWSDAAAGWRAPACGGAVLDVQPGSESDDWALRADGRSTVAFERSSSSIFSDIGLADGLGFTCWVCDDDGFIVESDVRFDGARVQWETDCDGDAFDVLGAAVHEFGHVLGFGHDDDPSSAMFAVTSERRLLDARSPQSSDVALLCGRYPCPDTACGEATSSWPDCPEGAALCAPCEDDAACGATPDRCLRPNDGGEARCGRACSASHPCPTGAACLDVGVGVRQCVPEDTVCADATRYVACVSEADCLEPSDVCIDGVCAPPCDGVACPADGTCEVTYDANGLVADARCGGGGLPQQEGGAKGGRCSAAPASTAWASVAVLGLLLRRRRCRAESSVP